MNHLSDQVLKSLQTVQEMLNDRGISTDRLSNYSEMEINALMSESPIFELWISEQTVVLYFLPQKFKFSQLRDYIDIERMNKVILITRDTITNANVKAIHEEFPIDIELFTLTELQYNVSKHNLVPKHVLISSVEEIQDILASFHLQSKTQLPIILKTDPMARYIGAKPGNLVRITRISPSAGEYTCYRSCL
jgi:DNA-directed RNA polymerase I, II, and III subunit RPABC1